MSGGCSLLKAKEARAELFIDASGRVVRMTSGSEANQIESQPNAADTVEMPVTAGFEEKSALGPGRSVNKPSSYMESVKDNVTYVPVEDIESGKALGTKRRFYALPGNVVGAPAILESYGDAVPEKVVASGSKSAVTVSSVPTGARWDSFEQLPKDWKVFLSLLMEKLSGLEFVSPDNQGKLRPDSGEHIQIDVDGKSYRLMAVAVPDTARFVGLTVYERPNCLGCFFNPSIAFIGDSVDGLSDRFRGGYRSALPMMERRTRYKMAHMMGRVKIPAGTKALVIVNENVSANQAPCGIVAPDFFLEWK